MDFNDTDTFEFLFKDYWVIVKEKEGLTLANLQLADSLLKSGEKFKALLDPDEHSEEQQEFEVADDECSIVNSSRKDLKGKYCMKIVKEKSKSKKRTYIGWASKELIHFLSSLGKDTREPLGQPDVYEIVKEYIQSKNLISHDKKKKKHVFCDANLLALFRRKKVNFFKVYSLLEKHLAENDDSDADTFTVEEDHYLNSAKRKRKDKSPSSQKMEHVEPKRNCFASVTEDNIKSIYLKRSLIVELLGDPKTFDAKVVGCFVRRKNDPKDFYGPPPKTYQLDQIIGKFPFSCLILFYIKHFLASCDLFSFMLQV